MTPPGSTDSSTVPSSGPPCDWKYHQGMPFCAAITAAPGRERRARSAARAPGRLYALSPMNDDVGVADRVEVVGRRGMRLEVAARAQHADAVAPAARAGASPRAISVTSLPPRASAAPT